MVKILANDGIDPKAQAKLEDLGYEVETTKVPQENLIEQLNTEEYQVLLVRSATKVNADVFESCKGLKLIGRAGVGLDNIDLDSAKSHNVKVFNTPSSSSIAVAELVMTNMFSLSRKVFQSNRKMPSEGSEHFSTLKKSFKGSELRGKTLGVIGFGRIGKALASYALGIGMNVLAHDRSLKGEQEILIPLMDQQIKLQVSISSFEEVLAKSDYISFHVPKQSNGSALIDKRHFSTMKKTVFLINTARGGVIEEFDLLDALDRGEIAGAALDVFENEPNPNEALLKHPKISVTPHIGAATTEAQARIGEEIIDNITAFFG